MTSFKSPKVTIGQMKGNEKEVENQFTRKSIQLQLDDRLYMATDGYKDQFGGEKDKKLMSGKFQELLLNTGKNTTLTYQEKRMIHELDAWMGTKEQTDDILLLGWEI